MLACGSSSFFKIKRSLPALVFAVTVERGRERLVHRRDAIVAAGLAFGGPYHRGLADRGASLAAEPEGTQLRIDSQDSPGVGGVLIEDSAPRRYGLLRKISAVAPLPATLQPP